MIFRAGSILSSWRRIGFLVGGGMMKVHRLNCCIIIIIIYHD